MSARFIPPHGGLMAIAIIDPRKAFGEPGQYVKTEETYEQALGMAEVARLYNHEVRFYYRGLSSDSGEVIGSQVIETWIPPGHVQPFHTHHTIHEMTLVIEGKILSIDSPYMTEDDVRADMRTRDTSVGWRLRKHQMVVEGPGTRHTIANPTGEYAVIVTVQTARMPLASFPNDWERDRTP